MRNLTINIFIFVASSLVFFSLAELGVRLFYKESTVLFPRYHTDVKYGDFVIRRIKPNTTFWHTSIDGRWKFTTNNAGFRNYKDFSYEKPAEVYRILSIGDSHTQGYEVRQDYTFSAVAEKYLKNHQINVEVLNTGVSGFSTAEELVFLENEGYRYHPDAVILGFFANDYEDNIKADLFKLDQNGNLIVNKKTHIPGVRIQNFIYRLPFVKWLGENSYFYSVLFNGTWAYFKNRLAKNASENALEYAVSTREKYTQYQEDLTSKLIERMYHFCKQNNIKLIILDIPQAHGQNQSRTSFTPNILKTISLNSDKYFTTDMLFSDYNGVVQLNVPHGHRHISEFTHAILGVSAAKYILDNMHH